jgi:hypothetical protein
MIADGVIAQKPVNVEAAGPQSRRTVRSRFKPAIQSGMRLEERDRELLCDLFLHRAMARGQIQALYFSSLGRCNARMRQLFDHGFVRRYYHPAAPYGAQAVYLVGKSVIPIVARRLEMELPEVARQARSSRTPTFIEHTLAIVDVRIAFAKAVKENPEFEMERWLGEPLCRHEYEIRSEGGAWKKEVFKPDAFIRLHRKDTGEHSNEYLNYFVEVDLGHTSSRQFLEKAWMYQRYRESGLFKATYGCDEFSLLVVTIGKRRLQNLKSLVENSLVENSSGRVPFQLTTFDSLSKFADLLRDSAFVPDI